jgi:hypothetical protein
VVGPLEAVGDRHLPGGEVDDASGNEVTLYEKGPRRISPFFIPGRIINLASGQVSIAHGLKGPSREGAAGGEAAERQPVDRRLGAAGQHHVGVAERQSTTPR